VHIAGAADRTEFALCTGDGRAVDHSGLPVKDQAHCLQLCLTATNATGCDPDGRGYVPRIASAQALAVVPGAPALPWGVAATEANRPRAPPA
jgi:hypothetical protein